MKIRVKRARNEVFSPPIFQSRRTFHRWRNVQRVATGSRLIGASSKYSLGCSFVRSFAECIPRSSIKCRVSRASSTTFPSSPCRPPFISSYEMGLHLLAQISPHPHSFLRISNISKLIGGEKMGDRISTSISLSLSRRISLSRGGSLFLEEDVSFSRRPQLGRMEISQRPREWRNFTRRRDLVIKFRYDRNPGRNLVSYLA